MHIVLIRWCIKADHEQDFLNYWSNRLSIKDKSALVSESLSKVEAPSERFNWDTKIYDTPEGALIYINVGIWRDLQAFRDAIPASYDALQPFEAGHRLSASLEAKRSRLGQLVLGEQLQSTLLDEAP